MTLKSGLNASLAGLRNYGRSVGIDADNVAKAGAVAAKQRENIIFTANTSESVQSYRPGGVSGKVQQYINVMGSPTPSQINTFMAINGQGMFVVNSSATPETGKLGFTRVGTFAPDKNGDFVNNAGQYLLVLPTDDNGDVPPGTDTVTTDGLVVASTAGLTGDPVATSDVTMRMTLPADKAVGYTYNVPIQVIDSLGVSHQITINWELTSAGAAPVPSEWTVTASSLDPAVTISAPYDAGIVVQFDANGNPLTINGDGTASAAAPNLQIDWGSGAALSDLTMFMGTIGNSDGARAIGTQANATGVITNGRTGGDLQGVSIDDQTGIISASYSNGRNIPFAKIPLATFRDVNQLLETTGGVFMQTINSGPYSLTSPGQNGAGTILSSNIEESTIDTTEQFTRLIVDQTNYTCNGKVISVINEILKESIQMIR